jgi:hypothetical protein
MTHTDQEAPTVAQSYPGTQLHAIRVPDDIWQAAMTRATTERKAGTGSGLSAEVVAFLTAYGNGEAYTLKARP